MDCGELWCDGPQGTWIPFSKSQRPLEQTDTTNRPEPRTLGPIPKDRPDV